MIFLWIANVRHYYYPNKYVKITNSYPIYVVWSSRLDLDLEYKNQEKIERKKYPMWVIPGIFRDFPKLTPDAVERTLYFVMPLKHLFVTWMHTKCIYKSNFDPLTIN